MTERETWRRTLWQINLNPMGSPEVTMDDVYGLNQKMSPEAYEDQKRRAAKTGFMDDVKGYT